MSIFHAILSQPVSFEPEVVTTIVRMSSEPTLQDAVKYNRFIRRIKIENGLPLHVNSLFLKFKALYIRGAHHVQAAALNWVSDDFDSTFYGGYTFTPWQGIQGDGSSAYIDTGFTPDSSVYQQNDASIGFVQLNETIGEHCIIGNKRGSNYGVYLAGRGVSANAVTRLNETISEVNSGIGNTGTVATFHFYRDDSVVKLFKDGVQIGSDRTVDGSIYPNQNFLELAVPQISGVIGHYADALIGVTYYGDNTINPDCARIAFNEIYDSGSEPIEEDEIPVPSGFPFTPPFSIFRDSETGEVTTDFNPSTYDFSDETGVTYYVSSSGNDSNDGLSESTPKKSIGVLVAALNSSPPSGGATIIVMTDLHYQDGFRGNDVTGWDIVLKTIDGTQKKISEWNSAGTFAATPAATTANCYLYSRNNSSANIGILADEKVVDDYGFPVRLRQVADLATCDATPGSFYRQSSSVAYIHTHDSRVPDSQCKGYGARNMFRCINSNRVYVENLIFEGGSEVAKWIFNTNISDSVFVAHNCQFLQAFGGVGGFIHEVPSDALCILHDCVCASAPADGFNYRTRASMGTNGPQVVEIGCMGNYNGFDNGPNNNGTTSHGYTNTIRINGIYIKNENRNVHDIEDCKTWMIKCKAGHSRNTANEHDSINFAFGRNATNDSTEAWLDDCESLGGSITDLAVYPSTVVKTKNMDTSGWNIIGTGTLTTY